jgi:hypothetical protein
MKMVTQSFTLTKAGKIVFAAGQKTITVNKGDIVQFQLTNDSGLTLSDWGLYFNNPFDVANALRYSFGATPTQGNLYSAEKTVSQDTATEKVAMYNAYAVYVTVQSSSGENVIYQRDPEIIVNDGDVED